jgi:hypothetical protein
MEAIMIGEKMDKKDMIFLGLDKTNRFENGVVITGSIDCVFD